MENAKKNLKILSALILALAGLSLVRVIADIFLTEFDTASLPEGTTQGIILIAQVIAVAISVLLLLPQIFVGVRGLKVCKEPISAKGHIVWAIVLAVFSAIAVLSAISGLANAGSILSNLLALVDAGLDVAVYLMYVKYAKQLVVEA